MKYSRMIWLLTQYIAEATKSLTSIHVNNTFNKDDNNIFKFLWLLVLIEYWPLREKSNIISFLSLLVFYSAKQFLLQLKVKPNLYFLQVRHIWPGRDTRWYWIIYFTLGWFAWYFHKKNTLLQLSLSRYY